MHSRGGGSAKLEPGRCICTVFRVSYDRVCLDCTYIIDWQRLIVSALIIPLRIWLVVAAEDLVFCSMIDLQLFEGGSAESWRRKGRYSIRDTDLEPGC